MVELRSYCAQDLKDRNIRFILEKSNFFSKHTTNTKYKLFFLFKNFFLDIVVTYVIRLITEIQELPIILTVETEGRGGV